MVAAVESPVDEDSVRLPENRRPEIERHVVNQHQGIELKTLGFAQDAARELGALTEQYSRDQDVLLAFSTLLSEVGAYHPALRVAKVHFREKLGTKRVVDGARSVDRRLSDRTRSHHCSSRCGRGRSLSGRSDHS